MTKKADTATLIINKRAAALVLEIAVAGRAPPRSGYRGSDLVL